MQLVERGWLDLDADVNRYLDGLQIARAFPEPITLRPLLTLPWVGAALAVAGTGMLLLAWRKGYWGLGMRLHYAAVAVAGLLFITFAGYWNLLGPPL